MECTGAGQRSECGKKCVQKPEQTDGQRAEPKVQRLETASDAKERALPARACDLGGSEAWGQSQSFFFFFN